jgi:hypothetical protein
MERTRTGWMLAELIEGVLELGLYLLDLLVSLH